MNTRDCPSGDSAVIRPSRLAVVTESETVMTTPVQVTIHAETAARKKEHDAADIDDLTRELERVSPRMERIVKRLERSPRRFALNVSNVPGPRGRMTILGTPVSSLRSLAEIGERHALRVAALSYADEICLGLCADPEVVHDLGDLARGIEAEAQSFLPTAPA